ncbi:MAG: hypothetical protein ACPG6V_08150 [Flavobacteriales bacterium]
MNKYFKLAICIFIDAIGLLSYVIPALGEISDVFWAPISSVILYFMFDNKVGKAGALINLAEELSPGLDAIPTLTLTWIYAFVIQPKEDKKNKK